MFNLPDAANVPATLDAAAADPVNSAAIIAGASQLSNFYTGRLNAEVANTRAVVFDLDKLTKAAVADPNRYGFDVGVVAQDGDGDLEGTACQGAPASGLSLFCLQGVNTTSAANTTFLFADGVHPSTQGHLYIAQALQGLFDGAVETARLLEALQRTQGQSDLWREAHLRPTAFSYVSQEGAG